MIYVLTATPGMPFAEGPPPPTVGDFYQNRHGIFIAQVVEIVPHAGVGYLVRIRCFHGPYPRSMTLNPKLFSVTFARVSLEAD